MKILITLVLILGCNPAFTQTLSLNDYLKKVESQNLDLKIEQLKLDTVQAQAIGFRLPPPMLGLIQMKPEGDDAINGFEISQDIPFPTKLSSDHNSRKYNELAQNQQRLISQKQILLKARLLYLNTWRAQEYIELLKEKRKILQEHIKLTKASARSDSFAQTHLLKTESDLDLIENEILSAQQDLQEKQIALAQLINADPNTEIFTAVEPESTPIPQVPGYENTPQYRSLQYMIESLKSQETQTRSTWLPDFKLKYKQMPATSMSKASQETMLGLSLPFVFFWQPYADVKKIKSKRLIEENKLANETRRIESIRLSLMKRAENLQKQLETLKTKLIPRANKRAHLLHNFTYRDMATLVDHRETLDALPELKIKSLNLRIKYEETVSELELLIADEDKNYE